MNPSVLPQVTVLLCLSVMVPVGIALIRAELLCTGMHYAVLAHHLIVGLALWIVIYGATTIVAADFKISINHGFLLIIDKGCYLAGYLALISLSARTPSM